MPRPVYVLELEAPDDEPIHRLRALLKYAKRVLGFRCVSAVEKPQTCRREYNG